jgi:hypothetical protein
MSKQQPLHYKFFQLLGRDAPRMGLLQMICSMHHIVAVLRLIRPIGVYWLTCADCEPAIGSIESG